MTNHPAKNPTPSSTEPRLSAPLVYTLGFIFIVFLMICYIKADVVLRWLESLTKALFL